MSPVQFVRVDGDVAVYALCGFDAWWMQSREQTVEVAAAHGVPDDVKVLADKSTLKSRWLRGPMAEGARVTTSFRDFAGQS